jgi:transposase InsO family protein
VCGHALSEKEKQAIVEVSNSPAYRDLSPWQMVARLADAGQYLGSESSFYRVLKQNQLLSHRQSSKPRVSRRPKDLLARHPNEVWSWDITYLNSPVRGAYYYLYLVEDIFSRMIVGWTVEELESAEHGARLDRSDLSRARDCQRAADVTFGQWRPDERGHLVGDSGAAGSGGVF